jgi:hypothetical protein
VPTREVREAHDAGRRAESAAQDVADTRTGQIFARAGIAARALVYLIVGILAVRIALGASGDQGDSTSQSASATGAVKALAGLPGGRALLAVLSLGLVGYAAFSLLDVCLHRRGRTRSERFGTALISAGSGLLYAAFAVWTASLVINPGKRQQSGSQNKEWSARVMGWPLGRELVGAVGLVILGVAVGFAWSGISRRFMDQLEDRCSSGEVRAKLETLGVVAYLGRALAFAVTGSCILAAAITFDPSQAEGLDGSLRSLAKTSYGPVLLFATAIGLIVFAGWLAAEVKYRKI